MTITTEKIAENEARALQLRQNLERARELENAIKSMSEDRASHERMRAAYAAHGPNRIEIPNPYRSAEWPGVECQPFLSRLSGDELAAIEAYEIQTLKDAIAECETEIKGLLKDAH